MGNRQITKDHFNGRLLGIQAAIGIQPVNVDQLAHDRSLYFHDRNSTCSCISHYKRMGERASSLMDQVRRSKPLPVQAKFIISGSSKTSAHVYGETRGFAGGDNSKTVILRVIYSAPTFGEEVV
jgi:hypothetical protein